MAAQAHREAEEHEARAELLMPREEVQQARDAYLKAAQLEETALAGIDSDKPRTRGIIAVSAASLYYKAAAHDTAATRCHAYLLDDGLPGYYKQQLEDLLESIWAEKHLQEAGQQLSSNVTEVALKGNRIGLGTAPANLVLDRISSVSNILIRITEWLLRAPLRRTGPPPKPIRDLCESWIGQAQAGSYRFAIRIRSSGQLALFGLVSPEGISQNLIRIIEAVSPQSLGFGKMESTNTDEIVPERDHRKAILRLIRNIVPDGQRVRELTFTTLIDQQPRQTALYAGVRDRIDDHLRVGSSTDESMTEIMTGTLRALSLERDWISVISPETRLARIYIEHEVLDDVIGPMVNRPVIVRVSRHPAQNRLVLQDIELDPAAESN